MIRYLLIALLVLMALDVVRVAFSLAKDKPTPWVRGGMEIAFTIVMSLVLMWMLGWI